MKKFLARFIIFLCIIIIFLAGIYFLSPGTVIALSTRSARWKAGVEVKTVAVGDHTWPYLTGGKGYPVLMLHGFGMHKDFWGELTPALTKQYRVVIPDLPGFGENSRIKTAVYDLPQQAKRVREFVKKIGLEKFYLIGFSMGGGIAAYYAGEYPDSVKGLVLIDALGIDTPGESDFEKLYKAGEKPLLVKNVEQFNRVMAIGYLEPPKVPGHIKKYLAAMGAKDYDFHEKIFDDLGKGGANVLENRLGKIQARTLILWGDKDRIFDAATASAFKHGIRDSRMVIVKGSGHMVYIEKPDEAVKAVIDFFAGF